MADAAGAAGEDLPRAIVRRVVKKKIADMAKGREAEEMGKMGMTRMREIPLHKEALLAFSESAKVFIHYLSATANDICRESKRQIISAEDVLKAVDEIEFPEFMDSLKIALEEFRRDNAMKKSEAKEKGQAKKRKSGGGNGMQEENGDAEKAAPPDLNLSPPAPCREEEKDEDVEDMEVS